MLLCALSFVTNLLVFIFNQLRIRQERQQGRQQGRLEERAKAQKLLQEERAKAEAEKLKSALNFKKMGLPIEDIAKGLGLTVEEIKKLK